MASRIKKSSPELEAECRRLDFMDKFPLELRDRCGDLISVWLLMYMGTQQGATSEEAFTELLAPSLFDVGQVAFASFDKEMRAAAAKARETEAKEDK